MAHREGALLGTAGWTRKLETNNIEVNRM